MTTQAIECKFCTRKGIKGVLHSYINETESWKLHLFPFRDLWIQADANFFGKKRLFADVLKCNECDTYGYVCPYCNEGFIHGSSIKHGCKLSCVKCNREFIMRNPSNFFSSK